VFFGKYLDEMTKAGAVPEIWAVEIHDLDERNVLAFDLSELLDTLGERAAALDWVVADYDPVTQDETVAAFADAVYEAQDATPRSGVRLSSSELRALAHKSIQTIDGQFIGIPPDSRTPLHKLVDLRTFADSDAALVIKAVDSSFWVVITKSDRDVALIRERFRDVREADRTLELGLRLEP
jgi:hypothetical protein